MNNYQWYPYADLVLKNANIYTVDLTISEIQSGKYDFTIISNGYIAIKDGKIISVGEGMDESFIGPETHVEDVEGKRLFQDWLIHTCMQCLQEWICRTLR